MRSTIRVAGAVVLASIVAGAAALGQDDARAPAPTPPPSRRPIQDSVDGAVEAVLLAHEKPCERADRLGVPCFPVTVEQEGPRFSVAEALRRYRGEGSPAPGVPTVAETQAQLSGAPLSPFIPFGSFDPVCTTKNLWKKLSGKNTTFHLYRTWDERGERPLLTDHLLDPEDYTSNLAFHYEYLGKYDGECEAVAAWRKALRKATTPVPPPAEEWRERADPPPPR